MQITERDGRGKRSPVIAGVLCAVLLSGCYRYPDEVDRALFDLRITELHYNPVDGDGFTGDDLEFIELKNVGSAAVVMSTCSFTRGIDYVFPRGAHIDAGGFYVVASNEDGFTRRYGKPPDGVYDKKLNNSADTIVLTDDYTGTDILSQMYAEGEGWPERPYGAEGEYSLVPCSAIPPKNPIGPDMWRWSVTKNGSPGADDILEPFDESLNNLRITEIHYHPAAPDSSGSDSLEFIELKNIGSSDLPLGKVAFTDGIRCTFDSGLTLGAGKFYVIASNSNVFRRMYDKSPDGVYTGKLSNSGESIVIEAPASNAVVLVISYGDENPWPAGADGEGYSLVPLSNNPPKNQNDPELWRHSFTIGGSPFTDDPGVVVVNEVLSNTDGEDAIELYNPGSDPVNIGGWFLTDKRTEPDKFRIPSGTVVVADGYVVFTAKDFNNPSSATTPFSLGAGGDDVYLLAGSSDGDAGYVHGVSFRALERNRSIGRHVTSAGKEVFVAQKALTFGKKNAGPLIGPVIFSEIGPMDGINEYVEITNISLQEVRLYDPDNPSNTWKIEGMDFTFPETTSIAAGESVIILAGSGKVDRFRSNYELDDEIQLFEGAVAIDDKKQKLALLKPQTSDGNDSVAAAAPAVSYVVVEEIEYHNNQQSWPAFGSAGMVLHRENKNSFGDDPSSWKSGSATPGSVDW